MKISSTINHGKTRWRDALTRKQSLERALVRGKPKTARAS